MERYGADRLGHLESLVQAATGEHPLRAYAAHMIFDGLHGGHGTSATHVAPHHEGAVSALALLSAE